MISQHSMGAVVAVPVSNNNIPPMQSNIVSGSGEGPDENSIFMEEEAIHYVDVPPTGRLTE